MAESSTCSSASAADSTYSIPNQQPVQLPTTTTEQVQSFKDLNKSTHPSDFKATKNNNSNNNNSRDTSITATAANKNGMNKFTAVSIDLKDKIEKCLESYSLSDINKNGSARAASTPTSNSRTSPTDNSSIDNTESHDVSAASPNSPLSSESENLIESLFAELLQFKYAGKFENLFSGCFD